MAGISGMPARRFLPANGVAALIWALLVGLGAYVVVFCAWFAILYNIFLAGTLAHWGTVAVDPSVIPLYSRLYIPGYGFAVAGDTGGAIVGNRIDLFFPSYSDAIRFGRRTVTVYVLE